jgi:hypothetical protein
MNTSDPVGVGEPLQTETSQARFTELYAAAARGESTADESGRNADVPTVEYAAGGAPPCCW